MHKVAECISGRWKLVNRVVHYNLAKPTTPTQPHHYKTLIAWTMSGSATICVDYVVPEATTDATALFERLLELGYVPATPAKPGML